MRTMAKAAAAAWLGASIAGCGGESAVTESPVPSASPSAPAAHDSAASDDSAANVSSRPSDAPADSAAPGEREVAELFRKLVAAHHDRNLPAWNAASDRLDELGPAGVGVYAERLASDDSAARELASMKLARLGIAAAPAADALVQALADDSPLARVNVASSLSVLDDPRRKQALPVLVALLASSIDHVRATAAIALGNFGPDAVEAVPTLVAALSEENPMLRLAAARTLGSIGPGAKEATPALEKLADDESEVELRAAVAESLAAIRPPAP